MTGNNDKANGSTPSWLTIVALCTLLPLAAWMLSQWQTQPLADPALPIGQAPEVHSAATDQPQPAAAKPDPVAVFQQQVQPILEQCHQEDLAATDRCLNRIHENFAAYRRGIAPFADEITWTSTRFGILIRMPGAWWNQDERTRHFTRQIFERHLFSEQQLRDDMSAALQAFRDELQVNRAHALIQIKVAVSESELPQVEIPETSDWERAITEQLISYVSRKGTEGIAILVASEATAVIVEALIVRTLAAIGTSAAVGAATGGGATVGGAAAGGGGGSVAGPVGTAAGFAVGLIAGILIDYWLASELQQRISQQLEGYLTSLERSLLDGSPDQVGLSGGLRDLTSELNRIQGELIMQRLIQGTH